MTFRRFIFWCHLITGIAVGSVIFIMALTGTIMAFEPQIVERAEHSVRGVTVPENAVRFSLPEIISKAEAVKDGKQASGVTVKSDPKASVSVSFGREGGSLFVNPYTGEILGTISKTHDFMHWVEDIHRKLGAKDKGQAVTQFCNAAFLFMILSGIYIWWPRNWNLSSLKAITLFNAEAQGKARDFNWHNVIGFWCLPMLLLTTLTGLVMSYGWANGVLFKLTGSEVPPAQKRMEGGPEGRRGKESEKERKPILEEMDFEDILVQVAERSPGWESLNFRFPQKEDAPVTVNIQESKKKYNNPSPRSQMSYDLETGEVTKWEPYSENSLGKKARIWVKYLHTGEWSVIGQIIAFISAIGALFLVYTGFALSWRRLCNFASGLRPTGNKERSK